jgi:RimJ/RimL family protein N-acetyltransferase
LVQIETDRLVLTPIGPEHADEILRLHSDPLVARWADPMSREQAIAYAEEWAARWRGERVGKWVAHRRADGSFVGRGGLSLSVVDGVRQLELGWALLGSARGRGYATEIGRAGLDFAFDVLGHDHVVSYTEVHNRASRAVMERLGMQLIKIIYASGLVSGRDGVHDDAPFALYRLDRGERSPAAVTAADP